MGTAEVVVGLTIIVALFRKQTVSVDELNSMRP